jgi:hypothetical protein
VIAEEDDIYGDGVNIAARLEALAEPGGICISRVVRDQIRDKLPYPFEDRGEQSVKNIARSVRVYELRPETVAELPAAGVSASAPRPRRIATSTIAASFAAVRRSAILSTDAGNGESSWLRCTNSLRFREIRRRGWAMTGGILDTNARLKVLIL